MRDWLLDTFEISYSALHFINGFKLHKITENRADFYLEGIPKIRRFKLNNSNNHYSLTISYRNGLIKSISDMDRDALITRLEKETGCLWGAF